MEDIVVEGDLGIRIAKYKIEEQALETMMESFHKVHKQEAVELVEEGHAIWRLLHKEFDLNPDAHYSYLCNTSYNPSKITIRERDA